MLGTSTAAVKSTLQRARARLGEAAPAPDDSSSPPSPGPGRCSSQYIAGFENADTAALETGAARRRRDRDGGHADLVLRPRDLPALPRPRDRLARRLADDPDPGQRPARRGRLLPRRRRGVPGVRGRRPHRHRTGIAASPSSAAARAWWPGSACPARCPRLSRHTGRPLGSGVWLGHVVAALVGRVEPDPHDGAGGRIAEPLGRRHPARRRAAAAARAAAARRRAAAGRARHRRRPRPSGGRSVTAAAASSA